MTDIEIEVIKSNSTGNCVLVRSQEEVIMLDCGMTVKMMHRNREIDIEELKGVLVTHEHGDHAKGSRYLWLMNRHIYMTEGTARKQALWGRTVHVIKAGDK